MSYTAPSTGSNRCLIVMPNRFGSSSIPTSVTWNGTAMTKIYSNAGAQQLAGNIWYLANPATGTHDIVATYAASQTERVISAFTLKDCAQSSPLDASNTATAGSGSSASVSTTTSSNGDYILTWVGTGASPTSLTAGGSQIEIVSNDNVNGKRRISEEAQTTAGSYTGSYSFTGNAAGYDIYVAALRGVSIPVSIPSDTYTYAGTGYANPHAVTQIANGTATTTYSYDNNGNLTSAISGATTTTYGYDYLNRLTSLSINGAASTTYGYDYLGQRVLQTTASTTFFYPNKFYSIASSTGTGARYATTTSYIWSGDGLLAYVEQALDGGVATGTASTYYVHPDHLGSTNVVTNSAGGVVSTKDYYPFGSARINSGTGSLTRGYITQFEDSSGLDYLQNRYYSPDRGQFTSQDPTHLAIGNPSQIKSITGLDQQTYLADPQFLNSARTMGGSNSGFASDWNRNTQSRGNSISQIEYLADPQMQNSYAYARGNPITMKDPEGLWGFFFQGDLSGAAGLGSGFAGTVSAGGGFVTDQNPFTDPTEVGGYTSYGGLAGGAFHSTTLEGSRRGPNPYTTLGLSGGPGIGVTLTNATRMSQLDGRGVTNTLTLGIGSVSWSVSKSGVWTISIAAGLKPAISFTVYPTDTNTKTVKTLGEKDSKNKK